MKISEKKLVLRGRANLLWLITTGISHRLANFVGSKMAVLLKCIHDLPIYDPPIYAFVAPPSNVTPSLSFHNPLLKINTPNACAQLSTALLLSMFCTFRETPPLLQECVSHLPQGFISEWNSIFSWPIAPNCLMRACSSCCSSSTGSISPGYLG